MNKYKYMWIKREKYNDLASKYSDLVVKKMAMEMEREKKEIEENEKKFAEIPELPEKKSCWGCNAWTFGEKVFREYKIKKYYGGDNKKWVFVYLCKKCRA